MRAWLLDDAKGPGSYRLGEIPTPEPGPGEVRVALRASALNHLDLWVAHGMPRPPSFPHVSGADGAGVVVDVGAEVDGVEPGDEVVLDPSTSCGACEECAADRIGSCRGFKILGEHRWGTHADAIVLPEANVRGKPPDLSWESAAAFGLVVSSAMRMAHRGRLTPGVRALVVGVGGGSATATFLVAKALGAEVFVTSTKEASRAWALGHGAAAAFESKDPYDELVHAATGDHGADVVFDNVGTVTFERSLRALARGGRLVMNGSTSGRSAELHLPTLFWRELEIVGATMNDHREFADAVALVRAGAVDVPVDTVFGFEELPAALERLEAGDQLGKIVLAR